MIDYEMEWTGLTEQIKKLGDYDSMANREAHEAMDRGVRFIKRDAVKNAPREQGELIGSAYHEVRLLAGELEGEVGFTDYKGLWVEYGTDAHWPPTDDLMQLMNVDAKHAHFIAKKIARTGTAGRFFLWKAGNRAISFVERQFQEAVEKLAQRLSV